MTFYEKFSRKISLAEALKLAWEIFSGIAPKLFMMLAALVIPVHLIYNYVMRYFTSGGTLSANLNQSASIGISVLVSPILLFVNLAVLDLLYGFIVRDNANIIVSFINALKKWFKSIVTMITALIILFAPVTIISIVMSILIPSFMGANPVNIWFIMLVVILAVLLIAAITYMSYLSISFMFMPMIVLVRDKWMVKALSYSKSLVKTRWFFCSILMMIITLFPVVFAVIGQRAGNNFFIILLFTIINAVIASFCSVLYMIYFLNFEKLNGISQAE